MQENKRVDSQSKKKARDLPGATLWLRDEAERANGSSDDSRAAPSDDTPLPLAASEYAEAARPIEGDADVMRGPDSSGHEAQNARAERVQDADFVEIVGTADVADAPQSADADANRATDNATSRSYAAPEPATPWMTIALAVAVLAAAWSLWSRNDAIASLEQAQARISEMSQAKASADRALSEAQSRLSAAEKAFADVKSALAGTPPAAGGAAATTKPAAQ
jgi:hypothetical protein